jgi:hypothetical protein
MVPRTRTLALAAAAVLIATLAVALSPVAAHAAVGCRISYVVQAQWSSGFTANVTVTNLGDPLPNWTLRLVFPDPNQYVDHSWPVGFTQTGREVIIVKPPWVGPLGTNQSFTVGFNGRGPAFPAPTGSLNGVPCTGAVITPTPTPTRTTPPPVGDPVIDVRMTSPLPDAVFTAPATVELAASAVAIGGGPGGVQAVDFLSGTTVIGTDTTAPYTFTWTNVPVGDYAVRARARAVFTFTSAPVFFIVRPATNNPPVVTLTDPTNRPVVVAPGTVTLNAEAIESDPRDVVNRMDLLLGTTVVAQSASGSGRFARFNHQVTVPGTYVYTVRAYDGGGGVGVSNAVTVTVVAS